MELFRYIKRRRWTSLFGYTLFVGMMATGYYYNLTFVQLGLVDLGERIVGLSERQVALNMALLAVLTCVTALVVGWWMKRQGWSSRFIVKLRLACAVVLVQTALTVVVGAVASEAAFRTWIVVASLALGVGVPATFSLTVDLIPVRDRGYAAALITAIAYFVAATFSSSWRIEAFRAQALLIMIPGALAVLALSLIPFPFLETLARQHERPAFFQGRYVWRDPESGDFRLRRSILGLIILMFGIYFVDSLGFLRLLDTPVYMNTAWQSPDVRIRAFIGATHVVTALIAGVLYSKMGERQLFLWIFGIFALTHFMYVFGLRFPLVSNNQGTLVEPMLYATAVSLYTVVNFAIWADVSTPRTISVNTAFGVALSGWTATFISTALALQWQEQGLSLVDHLNLVDVLAILLFLGLLLLIYFQPRHDYTYEVEQ